MVLSLKPGFVVCSLGQVPHFCKQALCQFSRFEVLFEIPIVADLRVKGSQLSVDILRICLPNHIFDGVDDKLGLRKDGLLHLLQPVLLPGTQVVMQH